MADENQRRSLKSRYFEDYRVGEQFSLGEINVSEAEIIEFAQRYDPQTFHIDPVEAKTSIYGGIIASGWHTGCLLMRCMVDNFISVNSMGSPGIEQMRWPRPVRGGDRLQCVITIEQARRSRSKPDRGILVSHAELRNQGGETVMEMTSTSFIRCRSAGRSAS